MSHQNYCLNTYLLQLENNLLSMISLKIRNNTVDIIRGIAMLMVVLQHTIARCCFDYSNTFLFNAIWSLQMPLFFIISGYVTRYSKKVVNSKELFGLIKRRTCAYLIPWLVWSFLYADSYLSINSLNHYHTFYGIWMQGIGFYFRFGVL